MIVHHEGVCKKLVPKAKRKGYELLQQWAHSISSHIYWAAGSSGGDAEEVKAKWCSVTNHVANIHTGHSDIFPNYLHDDIEEERLWIKTGMSLVNLHAMLTYIPNFP